jgi:DNA mismatch endonuclease Vsr
MADTHTAEHRSWNMSRIRNKNTKPEKKVRALLHRMGYRFSLHRKDLPRRPDIVMPKPRTVIFVHGCIWHQHAGCNQGRIPAKKLWVTLTMDLTHAVRKIKPDGSSIESRAGLVWREKITRWVLSWGSTVRRSDQQT